jgi:hypothetical protein
VDVEEVVAQTGFPVRTDGVPASRTLSPTELELLRTVLDPDGRREKEVPSS